DNSREYIRQWTFSQYGSIEPNKNVLLLKDSALAQVIAQNQGLIYADISTTPYLDDAILLDDGVKSKLSIPLTTQKGPYGSLNLGRRAPNAYTANDLNLLEQLISQVAIAIEKARLIDVLE